MKKFAAIILMLLIIESVNLSANQLKGAESSWCDSCGEYGDSHPCICDSEFEGTIMRPDLETLHEWIELYNNASNSYIDTEIKVQIQESAGTYFSLLPNLSYIPAERDQGSCGNCWVWSGTGVLEIALDVQEGVFDRLSIQYLNSKYNGGTGPDWACCGGCLDYLSNFYANEGFIIPWSNTNATWADGIKTCADQATAVPWETISTSPNYTMTECTTARIDTHGVGQETSIVNIKNVLHQNNAVYFGYYLPTGDDWVNFRTFWWTQPESAVWNPDYSCGHYWDMGGGGHAVLCVGYNDTDPQNRYWIMVNSWGTADGNRANGIFLVDMDMNYDCWFEDEYGLWYSLYWQTLNINFESFYSVSFYTNPDDVGSITFEVSTYTHSQSGSYSSGSYNVAANAPTGYNFHHWEYGGGVYVPNTDINPTAVQVSEEGWLKAVYEALITFHIEPSSGGSITYDGGDYIDGQSTWEVNLPPDYSNTVAVTAIPSECYTFTHWNCVGELEVDDPSANPATLTVNGTGDLTAVFGEAEVDLCYFPWPFINDAGHLQATFIYGKSWPHGSLDSGALVIDTVAGTELASVLTRESTSGTVEAILDVEATDYDQTTVQGVTASGNLTILGGSMVNLASLYYENLTVDDHHVFPFCFVRDSPSLYYHSRATGSDYTLHGRYGEGNPVTDYAVLELYKDGDRYVLHAAGICGETTRGVCEVLCNYDDYELSGCAVLIQFYDAEGDGFFDGPNDDITIMETVPSSWIS